MRCLPVLLALLSAGSCLAQEPEPLPDRFDFQHVDLALMYFAGPDELLLQSIAETPAALHLERHSNRSGYYPADATALDITRALLSEPPAPDTLAAVRNLVQLTRDDPARQAQCMAEASAYLPAEAAPRNPVHVTWGYDIGVAMDGHASLNFAHPHFLSDPAEIWYYCIHEVHHSGLLQLHPMARVADIDSVDELIDFVRYATFLEGLAVHAAREARRLGGALAADPDYAALSSDADRERILAAYREQLEWLRAESANPLDDAHWQVVEQMSSGQRLWYVAGAAMAAAIEQARGRAGLLGVERLGPDAFFVAYETLDPAP